MRRKVNGVSRKNQGFPENAVGETLRFSAKPEDDGVITQNHVFQSERISLLFEPDGMNASGERVYCLDFPYLFAGNEKIDRFASIAVTHFDCSPVRNEIFSRFIA